MHHETALVATIAAAFGLAFVLGLLAKQLKAPPLVGYLLAGVLLGPFTPGYVAEVDVARQLAEVGVILMMFGVGLHFSVSDLLSVRRIALPGALVQIGCATLLGLGLSHAWGWSVGAGLVLGLCLSVASTVVLLRALEDRRMVDTTDGRIAVGWLVVEDLVTVLVLVLLPALAGPLGGHPPAEDARPLVVQLVLVLAAVAAFVAVMLVVGRRAVPWLLQRVARTGSRELFTLAVIAVAVGIAVGAYALFGVSFALGAFFAGVVVNGSDVSHEAGREALPLQDAFSVLFFVSVGMLFDPATLIEQPLRLLAVLAINLVGKSLAALAIVLALRYPLRTALTISASLAQIGEFSFILAALGASLGLLPPEGQSLVVAGAILSIGLHTTAFKAADGALAYLTARPRWLARIERAGATVEAASAQDTVWRHHVLVIGGGRVGSGLADVLSRHAVPFVVVEQERATADALLARGVPVIVGDATRAEVLARAHPEHSRLLVLAIPEPYRARAVVEHARELNPSLEIVARARTDEERGYLEEHGATPVMLGDQALPLGLGHQVLVRLGKPEAANGEVLSALRSRWARTTG